MSYSIVDNVPKDKWSDFINKHPHGCVFQTPEMFKVCKKAKYFEPIFLSVVDDGKQILGVLLAVIQKEHSGFWGKFSSRSIIIGGPLVKNDDLEILYILLNEYKRRIKGKVVYSQFRNMRDWNFAKGVFEKLDFLYEDHLDILINLNKEKDELWSACSRDRKKSIKKGLSFLTIEEIDMAKHIDAIYGLLVGVYNRIKLPIPGKEYFWNACDILGGNGYLRTFGAFKNSNLIGVRIVLCYKELIYDWYAGANDSFLEYRPNDVLPWHVLLWGKNKGFKTFDFGGAGKPNISYGVRDYKLKFGGKLVNFGRFELIHKPVLYRLGLLGLFLFKCCYGIFKRNPK